MTQSRKTFLIFGLPTLAIVAFATYKMLGQGEVPPPWLGVAIVVLVIVAFAYKWFQDDG